MLRCFVGLLFFALGLASWLRADDFPGPALPLFDAYLAEAAKTVAAYRTDIRLGDDPKDAGAGRRSGESAFLGRFTYRPTTYAELSRSERALLVHDPQFHAYLVSLRRPSAPPSGDWGTASPSLVGFKFTIPPYEMLRSQPFVIVLPQ
jgi:hypothetical protein